MDYYGSWKGLRVNDAMCEDENIEIGDLVRLEDDEDYIIGIGIVIDVAADSRSVLN